MYMGAVVAAAPLLGGLEPSAAGLWAWRRHAALFVWDYVIQHVSSLAAQACAAHGTVQRPCTCMERVGQVFDASGGSRFESVALLGRRPREMDPIPATCPPERWCCWLCCHCAATALHKRQL